MKLNKQFTLSFFILSVLVDYSSTFANFNEYRKGMRFNIPATFLKKPKSMMKKYDEFSNYNSSSVDKENINEAKSDMYKNLSDDYSRDIKSKNSDRKYFDVDDSKDHNNQKYRDEGVILKAPLRKSISNNEAIQIVEVRNNSIYTENIYSNRSDYKIRRFNSVILKPTRLNHWDFKASSPKQSYPTFSMYVRRDGVDVPLKAKEVYKEKDSVHTKNDNSIVPNKSGDVSVSSKTKLNNKDDTIYQKDYSNNVSISAKERYVNIPPKLKIYENVKSYNLKTLIYDDKEIRLPLNSYDSIIYAPNYPVKGDTGKKEDQRDNNKLSIESLRKSAQSKKEDAEKLLIQVDKELQKTATMDR